MINYIITDVREQVGFILKSDDMEYIKATAQYIADTIDREWCPKYKSQVMPNDEGMCSMCGEHPANR